MLASPRRPVAQWHTLKELESKLQMPNIGPDGAQLFQTSSQFKIIKIKAGDELKKPPVIVMAPTANAAFIIGGKTIDSALGFFPTENNRYTKTDATRMAMMKFQYENVS